MVKASDGNRFLQCVGSLPFCLLHVQRDYPNVLQTRCKSVFLIVVSGVLSPQELARLLRQQHTETLTFIIGNEDFYVAVCCHCSRRVLFRWCASRRFAFECQVHVQISPSSWSSVE